MKKLKNAFYNPEKDGVVATLLGVFPAHLVGWVKGVKFNDSFPFNPIFRIAPEAAELKGTDYTQEDQPEMPAKHMVGREVRGVGIWLNPNPEPDQRGRNKGYVTFCDALGVEFPKNKDGDIEILEVEADDVLGKACLVNIKLETDKRDLRAGIDPKDARKFPKIFNILKWEDGKDLPLDELKNNPFESDNNVDDIDPDTGF